jgi:hypothetical protein
MKSGTCRPQRQTWAKVEQNLTRIIVHRGGLAGAVLVSGLSNRSLDAGPVPLGTVGRPIDLAANVSDAILPGGSPFQDSSPLFATASDPVQSAELPHISTSINPTPCANMSDAFASSLAQSNGNGGVGVSRDIFTSPDGSGENVVRQLLWGTPPNRDNRSATNTAQAVARVDTVITHPDCTFSKGGSFQFGLKEFKAQIPDFGGSLLNFANLETIGTDGSFFAPLHDHTDSSHDRVRWRIDVVSPAVDLGVLQTGDTWTYVYTLAAEVTTQGFGRGYAFTEPPRGARVQGRGRSERMIARRA